MSEDVVYSEVVFVKKNKTDQENPDESPSAPRPCCDRVRLLLVIVCVLVTVGMIALSLHYVYREKHLQNLQELHNALNENVTALSAALQDMHIRHQNLSRALNDSAYNIQACPKGWEYHVGKCYLFATNTLDWPKSRDACVSDGGHLVIINNLNEQEFLMGIIKNKYNDKSEFWIGLTDKKTEGLWLWVDNTEPSTNYWHSPEPDNWKGPHGQNSEGEDCAHINTPGLRTWFDAFCSRSLRRICETRSSRQT